MGLEFRQCGSGHVLGGGVTVCTENAALLIPLLVAVLPPPLPQPQTLAQLHAVVLACCLCTRGP